uniref:Uncharacterized protein n=1 Tax=Pristionchus pacificus TaxID=54126 RepID=A0A2A6CDK0_PRIPA|eukprot:PDM76196.1 hypothetical protein PRIPAC_39800 [Pristionchus pacificus]
MNNLTAHQQRRGRVHFILWIGPKSNLPAQDLTMCKRLLLKLDTIACANGINEQRLIKKQLVALAKKG